jgi:hypothetical protein
VLLISILVGSEFTVAKLLKLTLILGGLKSRNKEDYEQRRADE